MTSRADVEDGDAKWLCNFETIPDSSIEDTAEGNVPGLGSLEQLCMLWGDLACPMKFGFDN